MQPPKIKLFLDCADIKAIRDAAERPEVAGVTTNPTLARKAGVTSYIDFCREAVTCGKPISFEVISDQPPAMLREAKKLASLGKNVYVKIPVTDCEGVSSAAVIRELSQEGVQVNATAVFTLDQVWAVGNALQGGAPSVISVFAGRIADAGVDPVPLVSAASVACRAFGRSIELLWASSRELYNVVQAEQAGCDIITITPDLFKKLGSLGKSLDAFSLDTVRMFTSDAKASGFSL